MGNILYNVILSIKQKYTILYYFCRSGGYDILFIRSFAFAKQWVIWHLIKAKHKGEDVELNILGNKTRLSLKDIGLSRELIVYRIHEPISTQLIRGILKEGMNVVDIGANRGYYVLQESKLVGTRGKVFAFEPVPLNIEYLKQNLSLNGITNVKVYDYAIGAEEGIVKMYIQPQSNLGSLLRPQIYNSVIEINMRKLDHLLLHETHVDLVRMDIEGFEEEALNGMTQLLNKYKPRLFIELHTNILKYSRTKNLLEQIKRLGYEVEYIVDKAFEHQMISQKRRDKCIERVSIDKLLLDRRVKESRVVLMIFFKNTIV